MKEGEGEGLAADSRVKMAGLQFAESQRSIPGESRG